MINPMQSPVGVAAREEVDHRVDSWLYVEAEKSREKMRALKARIATLEEMVTHVSTMAHRPSKCVVCQKIKSLVSRTHKHTQEPR